MPISILMPALSPTMTEGKLAKWTKKEGDKVKPGEVIAEIETDKATMEVEAVDAGTIGKILVPAGTEGVAVNKVIGVLLEAGEDASSIAAFLSNDNKKTAPAAATAAQTVAPAMQVTAAASAPAAAATSGARVFATPLARRIAKDKGVNLSTLRGSGPHGRILKSDVENAKPGASGGSSSAMRTPSGPGARQLSDLLGMAYDASPVSGMRKTIAARLSESKQTIPHFYLTTDCRIDTLLNARKALNEAADGKYKLSVNDFVIKAVAAALMKIPAANMAWADNEVLQYKNADISVAVATPNGLITPIVKEAQNKTLPQISAEMKDLATRARDGKLKPTEYQGGTFSISNLGMYGVKDFAAIINPPQACILAVGAGVEQPVVQNGQIVIGTVMSVTLSVDHRVVDGAVGAEYLQAFKDYIENPILMLV
jgi:pyruvate dehydrogenase E2 component (dihydrolipoamide acetyltransferase)